MFKTQYHFTHVTSICVYYRSILQWDISRKVYQDKTNTIPSIIQVYISHSLFHKFNATLFPLKDQFF